MSKLRQLFSARALAATAATAMLFHTAVTALAGEYWTSAWCMDRGTPCLNGASCVHYCYDTGNQWTAHYYWCCAANDTCGYYDPTTPPLYGSGSCYTP